MPPNYQARGSSQLTPTDNKNRKEVRLRPTKTESIVLVGSELYYNTFWLKMMFIAASSVCSRQLIRPCDKKTLAYIDRGYENLEKLSLESIAKEGKFEIAKITNTDDLINLLNRDRENYRIKDVFAFSHGLPGKIEFNFWGSPSIKLSTFNLSRINPRAFSADGRFHSYACRTGVGSDKEEFSSEAEAYLKDSLAAKMSQYFHIEVRAFLRRTFYGDVLRDPSQSEEIRSALNRLKENSAGPLSLSAEFEALPHPGLGSTELFTDTFIRKRKPMAAYREGTIDYSLWRKKGGRNLPIAADSPTGLSSAMRTFTPQE